MNAYQVTVVFTTKIARGHPVADRFPGERDALDSRWGWQRGRLIVFATRPQHARDLVEHEHRDLAKEHPFKISKVEPITTAAVYRLTDATPSA